MENFTIDYRQFLAGASSADGIEDAGYSPKYGGHNIHHEADGILYPQHALDFIAWSGYSTKPANDPVLYVKNPLYQGSSSDLGVLVDESGNFYSHSSINALTLEATDSTNTYRGRGNESGVSFQTNIYVSNENNIVLVNITSAGQVSGITVDWWTTTRGHSGLRDNSTLVVVEDTLYIINENKIHTWDGTTSVQNALILPPDFFAMSALKHPNGRDLIVFGTVKDDPSETAGNGFRAYYINLVDLEFTDEIQITREVQGCWNVGGTIYVTSNEHLCIFDGNDVNPLRKLTVPNYQYSPANDLRAYYIRTHHGTVTDDGVLILPDGDRFLAIGDNGLGNMIWHPFGAYSAEFSTAHMAFNIGNKQIGIHVYDGDRWSGIANLKQAILKMDKHDGQAKWASNKYRYNQKAWVRRIDIDHETLASSDDFRVGHIKEDGTEQELRAITHTKYGAKHQTRIDCNIYTDIFQLYLEWVTGAVGIKKITIFYENGE